MKNVKNHKSSIKSNFEKVKKDINSFTHSFASIKNRIGVMDIQLNWIFVLIAGFVIFLFIISIAFSQRHNAQTQADIGIMNQITTLLKGKQQTSDMYSEITFPRTDIEFTCSSYSQFSFNIANAQPAQLPVEIIFTPKLVNTNKIMVWSQPFTLGFPVSIFTYITTPNSVILIFNDGDATNYDEQLFSDLDSVSNITHKYITEGTENAYSGFSRRTIVCFHDADASADNCPSAQDFDYIKIFPAKDLFDYGNVTFHNKGDNAIQDEHNTLPYITKAGLYGAIFSNSKEFYSCQMSRAMTQFEIKRTLIQSRLTFIQNDLQDPSDCKDGVTVTLNTEIASMQNPVLKWDNVTNLYQMSNDLDRRNSELGLKSCPKLY